MTQVIKVTPELLDNVARIAHNLTPIIAETWGDGRKGGYIFICDDTGTQLLHKKLGEPELSKKEKYRSFSREKAERLIRNPDHVLSWESREPEQNQYGGAIRLESGLIISFSGFPELVDEAFCAVIGFWMTFESQDSLAEKLRKSDNSKLFADILDISRPS